MSQQAQRRPEPARRPMLRLDSRRADPVGTPGWPQSQPTAPTLFEGPRAGPLDERSEGPHESLAAGAMVAARALSDDERLTAAALYLWLRDRALSHDGEGPMVLACDRDGVPLPAPGGGLQTLGGRALDNAVAALLAASVPGAAQSA